MTAWCILRTAGRHTLRLAASLAEDGFEVWTPVEVKKLPVPRMNAKRDGKVAMLPSFVFAGSDRLVDLIALSRKHRKEYRALDPVLKRWVTHLHPDFSLFQSFGRIHTVADSDLNPLRRIARRRIGKVSVEPLRQGQTVKAGQGSGNGSLQGMTGKVVRSNDRMTLVCFGGGLFSAVEIPTSTLIADDVCGPTSAVNRAALRAA